MDSCPLSATLDLLTQLRLMGQLAKWQGLLHPMRWVYFGILFATSVLIDQVDLMGCQTYGIYSVFLSPVYFAG